MVAATNEKVYIGEVVSKNSFSPELSEFIKFFNEIFK